MLPPPSSSLGRSHSIIILLMVDRGTDNWCQPPFALVFSPRRRLRVQHPSVFELIGPGTSKRRPADRLELNDPVQFNAETPELLKDLLDSVACAHEAARLDARCNLVM